MRACRVVFQFLPWSTLRTIGNSYVSIISVLVPLLGYVLAALNLDPLITQALFPEQRAPGNTAFSSEAYFRIQMTYVGFAIVGLTTLAFQVCCPSEVRRFESALEYSSASLASSSDDTITSLSNELSKKPWYADLLPVPETLPNFSNAPSAEGPSQKARTADKTRLLRTRWLEINTNPLNAGFTLKYQRADFCRFLARLAIGVGFALGYTFVLLPSIMFMAPHLTEVTQWVMQLL